MLWEEKDVDNLTGHCPQQDQAYRMQPIGTGSEVIIYLGIYRGERWRGVRRQEVPVARSPLMIRSPCNPKHFFFKDREGIINRTHHNPPESLKASIVAPFPDMVTAVQRVISANSFIDFFSSSSVSCKTNKIKVITLFFYCVRKKLFSCQFINLPCIWYFYHLIFKCKPVTASIINKLIYSVDKGKLCRV